MIVTGSAFQAPNKKSRQEKLLCTWSDSEILPEAQTGFGGTKDENGGNKGREHANKEDLRGYLILGDEQTNR